MAPPPTLTPPRSSTELDRLVECALSGAAGGMSVLGDWLGEHGPLADGLARLADGLADEGAGLRAALADDRLTPLALVDDGATATVHFRFDPLAERLDDPDAPEAVFALSPALRGAPASPAPAWLPPELRDHALVALHPASRRLLRTASSRLTRWLGRLVGDGRRSASWSAAQATAFFARDGMRLPRPAEWAAVEGAPLELVECPQLSLPAAVACLVDDRGALTLRLIDDRATAIRARPVLPLVVDDREQAVREATREALAARGAASARVRPVVRALRRTYRTYHEAITPDTFLATLESGSDGLAGFDLAYHLEQELGLRVLRHLLAALVARDSPHTVADLVGRVALLEDWGPASEDAR